MSIDVFGHLLRETSIRYGRPGPPGVGFKLTSDGDFDLGNRKLCNLGSPVNPDDAVSLRILEDKINEKLDLLQRRFSFEIGEIRLKLREIESKKKKHKKRKDLVGEETIKNIQQI